MSGGKSTNLGVTSIRMGGYDSEHYSSLLTTRLTSSVCTRPGLVETLLGKGKLGSDVYSYGWLRLGALLVAAHYSDK